MKQFEKFLLRQITIENFYLVNFIEMGYFFFEIFGKYWIKWELSMETFMIFQCIMSISTFHLVDLSEV